MAVTQKNTQDSSAENKDASTSDKTETGAIGTFFEDASNIVLKAAGILEKEIARGIVAAKQVEERFVDVSKIRSGQVTENKNVNDLIISAREIVHQLADIIIDLGAITIQNVGKLSSRVIKISSEKSGMMNNPPQQVPLIQVPQELKAGETAEFPVMLENDNSREEKNIRFTSTPFSDSSGNQLPSETLSFNPNPLIIAAASKGTVNVKITIPSNASPGSYTSFVQGQDMDSLKATLMVKVVAGSNN